MLTAKTRYKKLSFLFKIAKLIGKIPAIIVVTKAAVKIPSN